MQLYTVLQHIKLKNTSYKDNNQITSSTSFFACKIKEIFAIEFSTNALHIARFVNTIFVAPSLEPNSQPTILSLYIGKISFGCDLQLLLPPEAQLQAALELAGGQRAATSLLHAQSQDHR
jgi:hypothetical protein